MGYIKERDKDGLDFYLSLFDSSLVSSSIFYVSKSLSIPTLALCSLSSFLYKPVSHNSVKC